jgi:hypothetical protein
MADDDDTIPVEQTPESAPTASGGDEPASTPDAPSPDVPAGVRIPGWLAGALVVVLALLVAAAGFAIGRATAPDGAELRGPALIGRLPGADGSGPGGFPGADGRGPGGFPGGPGGSGGRERGPRFESGGSPDEQGPQPPGSGGTGNGDTGNGGTGN